MKPYRPSNGTEGEIFESNFCNRCALRAHQEYEDDCEIWVMALALPINSIDYPREWIEDANGPRCTAFTTDPDAPPALDPNAVIRPLL